MTDPVTDVDFQELVGGLVHELGPDHEEEEEEVEDGKSSEEAPKDTDKAPTDVESQDKPPVEPDGEPEKTGEVEPADADPVDTEEEPADEPDAKAAEEAAAKAADKDKAVEPDPDDTKAEEEPTAPEGYVFVDGVLFAEIVQDGETIQVSLEDLRKGNMRQADYTRKTQQLSGYREEVVAALADQRALDGELVQHDGMREFLTEHPDAREFLLEKPDATRRLMRNAKEFEAFTEDFALLRGNANLAKAYLAGDDATVETGRQEQQEQEANQQLVEFANELDVAIDRYAAHEDFKEHVSDEDVQGIKNYLMHDLGGFNAQSSAEEMGVGIRRLAGIFITPDGSQLDMRLVLDRMESIKSRKTLAATREKEAADEHNQQVDAELAAAGKRAPGTPDGGAPGIAPEKLPERKDFFEVLHSIQGDD